MADIQERFGFPDETQAQNFAMALRLNGFSVEVMPEIGGTWLVRAYPKEFGTIEPALNVRAPETNISDPVPEPTTTGVQGLLDFIAKFESRGNYNAYFRHARNDDNPKLTSMKLKNVIQFQRDFVRNGSPSSAAGKYQIIRKTLETVINQLGLSPDTRFNGATQEQMGLHLLKGRGLAQFQAGSLSVDGFGNNIAKEWAGMPVLRSVTGANGFSLSPGQSFYAGDGLNKALAGVDSFRRVVAGAR